MRQRLQHLAARVRRSPRGGPELARVRTRVRRALAMFLCALAAPLVFASAPLPPAEDYVTVAPDGHLQLKGQRIRFWGVIGSFPNQPRLKPADTPAERSARIVEARREADAIVQRFEDLGFNLSRFWYGPGTSDPRAELPGVAAGEGSRDDMADYFVARMKDRGLKLWSAGLNQVAVVKPEDVAVLDDPGTAAAWQSAVAEMGAGRTDGGWPLRGNPARIWDPRLEALALARMERIAKHFNPHTGLRWCDDPVFAVWELSNEEWWIRRMLAGSWQRLPAFFRQQLSDRWNGFLRAKYGTDAALRSAWGGLLEGENLPAGTVLFAPMAGTAKAPASLNDANPLARAALAGLPQEHQRAGFSRQRGADVLDFLLQLQLAHKRREAAAVKSWGRSMQLSPLVYDTGIGYEIQSQFLHQSADAVAHDAYVNGWGVVRDAKEIEAAPSGLARMRKTLEAERLAPNSGPWINALLKPPAVAEGVPWIEAGRPEGKPFFVYETQIQQPAKYRADFPLRITALAAIQDFDIVCWHYWGPAPAPTQERGFERPLDVTTGAHPQGYHFTFDEVQAAMMRAAGLMFRHQLLAPAPAPTIFVFGRESLLDPDSMDYGGSYGSRGMDMLQTVYQYGARIRIDPTRTTDEVIGPVIRFADRNRHNPYTPTREIVFDWQRGFLRMDSPSSAVFTGLLARYGDTVEFSSGVRLCDVEIRNPSGIFDPVSDSERYIAFALHANDGRPLAQTRSASLSLVSTSFNTGFSLGPPRRSGTLPVLVARVGGTIRAPALAGMAFVARDWHMKVIAEGRIGAAGEFRFDPTLPIFVVELSR